MGVVDTGLIGSVLTSYMLFSRAPADEEGQQRDFARPMGDEEMAGGEAVEGGCDSTRKLFYMLLGSKMLHK